MIPPPQLGELARALVARLSGPPAWKQDPAIALRCPLCGGEMRGRVTGRMNEPPGLSAAYCARRAECGYGLEARRSP